MTQSKNEDNQRANSKPSAGNVLVVEDEEDCADVICALLSAEGYRARSVFSRDDALLSLRQHTYDVIIMDVNMPGISLEEFIEDLKEQSRIPKIILLSAIQELPQYAKILRVPDWISKPFDPDKLLNVVSRLSTSA